MVTNEMIDHLADLSKLYINEKDYEKYVKQCSDILTEINKINLVEVKTDEIMISPSDNVNCFSEDIIESHISKDLAFKNAKRVKGDYITVPKVLGDE